MVPVVPRASQARAVLSVPRGRRAQVMAGCRTANQKTYWLGMLQQTYAADASAAPGHAPPLIGETNSSIILQAMVDTPPLADTDKKRRPRSAQPRPSVLSTITLVTLTLTSTPA